MTRLTRWAMLLSFVLIIAACSPKEPVSPASVDAELERLAARAAHIEIIRDDYGVPHVYGKTDADAVFGMLYAQAEDDSPPPGLVDNSELLLSLGGSHMSSQRYSPEFKNEPLYRPDESSF